MLKWQFRQTPQGRDIIFSSEKEEKNYPKSPRSNQNSWSKTQGRNIIPKTVLNRSIITGCNM